MKHIFFPETLDVKKDSDLVHILKSDIISHTEDRRKLFIISGLVLLLIFVFLVSAVISFEKGNYFFVIIDGFFVLFSLFFLWYFFTNLKDINTSKWMALSLFFLLQFIILVEDTSKESIMWTLTFPVVCVFLVGFKFGLILSVTFLSLILLAEHTFLADHFHENIGDTGHDLDFHFVTVYVLLLVVVLSYEFIRVSTQDYFAKFSKKLVDSIRSLEQRKEEYQILMKNVVTGLLLLDEGLKIQKTYSHSVKYMFGVEENLENKDFFDFIRQKTFAGAAFRIRNKLDEIVSGKIKKDADPNTEKDVDGEDVDGEDVDTKRGDKSEEFSFEVQIRDEKFQDQIKILLLSFSPVRLYNGSIQIMVKVKDITDRKKLKEKLNLKDAPRKRDLRIIEEALSSNKALFKIFLKMVGEKNELLKELQLELVKRSKMEGFDVSEVTDIIDQIFSITHALKGNASIAGFSTSANILHGVEVDLKKIDFSVFQKGKDTENFTKSILMAVEIVERIYRHFDDLSFIMDELFSFANEGASEKSMMDLDWLVDSTVTSYNASIDEKVNVHIDTKNFNSAILKNMKKEQQSFIFDSIVQLVKNSLVHGFKDQKTLKIVPTITISDTLEIRDGKSVCIIDYRDNGRGIDWKKIKDAKGKSMSFKRAQERIFDTDYSQSATVDTHAGNGLGMSMIKKSAEKIGVSMNIPAVKKGFALQFLLRCN